MCETVTKTCTKCGETKLLDAFYRDKSSGDGLQRHCSCCKKVAVRRWKQSEAGKEAKRKYRQSEAGKTEKRKYRQGETYKRNFAKWMRNRQKQQRDSLHDAYVKELLVDSLGIQTGEFPDEMIELKREALEYHRLSKQLKNLIKENKNG